MERSQAINLQTHQYLQGEHPDTNQKYSNCSLQHLFHKRRRQAIDEVDNWTAYKEWTAVTLWFIPTVAGLQPCNSGLPGWNSSPLL